MNPAELRLAAKVKTGGELDLSGCSERERTLRADILREILLSPAAAEPGAGARLRGAVIAGVLDLSQVKTTTTVNLTDCQVTRILLGGQGLHRFALHAGAGTSSWITEARVLWAKIGNQPAFITAVLFGFVVIKVVWIARGDIPTALGVFNSAGLATVIAGGLLSAFPLISAAVLGLAVFKLVRSQPFRKAFPFVKLPDKSIWVTGLAAAVGCFFLTPWPVMASGAIIGAVAGGVVLVASKMELKPKSRHRGIFGILALSARIFGILALLAMSFILVLNPLLYAVWLPHETLTLTKQSQQSMTGYVLSDSNGWVSLLETGVRRIYWFPSQDVLARNLCQARSFSMLGAPGWYDNPSSLWNIAFPKESRPHPPSCP
jgi:hypothetical protein